jgi:hypothetical protein
VAAVPGVDVVVYGEGACTPEILSRGLAVMAAPGTKGRYVGHLSVDPALPRAARLRLVPVRTETVGPASLRDLADRAAFAQDADGVLGDRFVYRDE